MKSIFEITDKKLINEVLNKADYGTLAISYDNKPYSLPINFVKIDDALYFHGSKEGRKIDILKKNQFASFSVVESYSIIQSYFSSNDESACPATQFFKSIILDGRIEFVQNSHEKIKALAGLMLKLQPEGKHKSLGDEMHKKMIDATVIYKLIPDEMRAKFKFGQHLNKERFDMIIKHLQDRNKRVDKKTIELMKNMKS